MPSYAERTARAVIGSRPGLVRVELDDGSRAYGLTQLTGPVAVGDRLVVNTTAVDRGLGTGGWHVIHWNLTAGPFAAPGPGHLMKLRYTSLQVDTGALEEDRPAGETGSAGLEATPVVAVGLHSQVGVVAAAIAQERPGTRVVYVMTDGGALPIALSDLVADLRRLDLVHATITAGHAFGGDLEALNVPSALEAARHLLDAEVIVAGMGPGVAGTGTRLGFTGLEVAAILDAVDWLGGRPLACIRASSADRRERHRGVSHHTRTVLDAVRSEVDVAHPPGLAPVGARHRWHEVDPGDPATTLERAGLSITTMGRGPDADPAFFAAAAAAGVLAGRWAAGREAGG